MAKVHVNNALSAGGYRHQYRTRSKFRFLFMLLRLFSFFQTFTVHFSLYGLMNHLAFFHRRLIINFHILNLVQRKFIAAIFTQHAHGIGTALAAMAHHVHIAGAAILQILQFIGVGPR